MNETTAVDPRSQQRAPTQVELAWLDLKQAIEQYWFWVTLGWNDILHRYRGSVLGPFWLTITTAIFITGLGPLYAALFGLDTRAYLPFMAIGLLVWNFITGTIHDTCRAFIDGGTLMKQIKLPRMTPIFHALWRNMIIFAHNLPVLIAVLIYGRVHPSSEMLMAIPGFALLCLNLLWIGLFLAIVCLRFRDVLQIVSSILTLGFFLTPVLWSYKTQPVRAWIVNINPFAALIELVRAPLLGEQMSPPLLALAVAMLIVGAALSVVLFVRYRKQIIYWV